MKGIDRLDIPEIMITDGPHGLRKQEEDTDHLGLNQSVKATCFPTASALASSWDRNLIFSVGQALGEECKQEGVSVLLGPGANIKRSPLCGRNFEYFSEDPFLTGELAAAHINGVQSQGIGTSLKHYAVNNQEHYRFTIDAIVDQRTLREIYLPGFETAVKKAQPWTVMCAYNGLNGDFCCEHEQLLTHILKEEWGHTGLVVTDWGATNDRVKGLKAGLELEMPASKGSNDKKIIKALKSGQLLEKELDKAVARLLFMILKSEENLDSDYQYDVETHHTLARKVAAESMVLLKNEKDILPLAENASVAVIGEFAKTPRYQGSGSSLINPIRMEKACDEIRKIVPDENQITFARGYDVAIDRIDQALIEQACSIAEKADVAVIFAGLPDRYESEGFDREHLRMPDNHNALIEAVSKVNPNVVVALSNGSVVEMPWIGKVQGVLEGYLGGQAGGGAFADVLFGKVNPSGKLAETFPVQLDDNPLFTYFPEGPKTVEYRESIYVGYHYYDKVDKEPLFPFGYGLSYTTFEYTGLSVSSSEINDSDKLTVSVTVKNTGLVAGKEVVQLYVRDLESSVFRPEKELKEFNKVALGASEEKNITFILDKRSFAFYNVDKKDWQVEAGEFEILIGSSSRDIHLSAKVTVNSVTPYDEPTHDALKAKLPSYYHINRDLQSIGDAEFAVLYGKDLPDKSTPIGGPYSPNSTMNDIADTKIGKLLKKTVMKSLVELVDSNEMQLGTIGKMEEVVGQLSLRMFPVLSSGKISLSIVDSLVLMLNGKRLRGIAGIIGSILKK